MKAHKYIATNSDLNRYHQYSMSLHLSKLKLIKDRKSLLQSITPCPRSHSNKKYLESCNS